MADQRQGGIVWTEETWNPIRGCIRANKDCLNCYAEQLAGTRLQYMEKYAGLTHETTGGPRWTGEIRMDLDDLLKPLSWTRPRLVFTNSMSDLFYEKLPFESIDLIVAAMALSHWNTFQVLTKRPDRMFAYLSNGREEKIGAAARQLLGNFKKQPRMIDLNKSFTWGLDSGPVLPIPNIWWGASMGHQKAVTELYPALVACRPFAEVLWVSAEPLWEPEAPRLDFGHDALGVIDWMVGGGESGDNARPCRIEVARALRDDCRAAGVAFLWKQWGEWTSDGRKVGKHAAGRVLDGEVWNDYPAQHVTA